MQIVRSIEQLNAARESLWRNGATLALVPTMGALHAGHMALVAEARRRATHVAASIFVNPLQFGAGEDLDRYPRQEQADARMLEDGGCDLLWTPGVEDLYPQGFATTVSVAGLSRRWEGEARPGHFDGVATVVAKLLIAVRPDIAIFGEKDFQQLAVIRRMALDLALPVGVVGAPTVRDADGLALSSRNAYLTAEQRTQALALPRMLERARDRIAGGAPVDAVLSEARQGLKDGGFASVDYVALVDANSLEPASAAGPGQRLIAAATIGKTRLIDNLAVGSPAIPGR